MAEFSETIALIGREFTNLPTEIQSAIISALYSAEKFDDYTAILRTSKSLHNLAYPLFLSNYPLECMPVKPGHPNASRGLGRGDILKIVYPHDDERFRMHLFEPDWLEGVRTGMEGLFEIDDEEEEEGSDREESGEEEEWEEDEADFDAIEGFDINDMGSSLSERGEQFARHWIRANPFARLLRRVGKEKSGKLCKLNITWGSWEANRMGELLVTGPYAVGIMSIVCSLFLPHLKRVTLKQTTLGEGEEEFHCQPRFQGHDDETEREEERWPESLREIIMGPDDDIEGAVNSDQGYMIRAVRLLTQACPDLQMLELRDWKSRGNPRWWMEMFETETLVVRFV